MPAAGVAVALALLTSCADAGANAGGPPSAVTASAARQGCLPVGDLAASTQGGYGVGQTTTTFVDHSRVTDAAPGRGLAAKPERTIPVVISYPITPAAGASPTAAAVTGAAAAPGSFPLVVLSHGITSNGPQVAQWIAAPFVRAGYVVASPTFPLSSGPGGQVNDLPNQPGDVSFVITSMAAFSARPDSALNGHVQADCVAIAGHSMGAATTLAAAYLSCCRDSRVRAVISMSGVLAAFRGTFADNPPIPLLILHGDKDPTVPYAKGVETFTTLRGPRYFVTVKGADHLSLFVGDAGKLLDTSVVAFLDAYLKGDLTGLRALPGTVGASGIASYQSAD